MCASVHARNVWIPSLLRLCMPLKLKLKGSSKTILVFKMNSIECRKRLFVNLVHSMFCINIKIRSFKITMGKSIQPNGKLKPSLFDAFFAWETVKFWICTAERFLKRQVGMKVTKKGSTILELFFMGIVNLFVRMTTKYVRYFFV